MRCDFNSRVDGEVFIVELFNIKAISHKEIVDKIYNKLKLSGVDTVVLDLKNINYFDSSAFGFLLLLNDYLNSEGKKLIVKNMSNNIKENFENLNFHLLIDFE